MTDLAAEAQVSVGAIYRSFASKAEIIRAIIEEDTQGLLLDLLGHIERVRAGDRSIAAAIQEIFLHRLSERDDAMTHEVLAEGHRNPQVADTITSFCDRYLEALRDLVGLAKPGLSGERLEGAAELLMACMFGMGHRELSRPTLSEADSARIAADLVLRALNAPD